MGKKSIKGKGDETDNLKSQLARALADYDNLVKRIEREKDSFSETANLVMIKRLVLPIDMLYETQKHLNDTGLAIAINEFEMILSDFGVEKIEPKVGEKFDENLHEVVEAVAGGKESTVAGVVLIGWRYKKGIVIRHAKVKVYTGK
jgi:molecular chaperone GrpE